MCQKIGPGPSAHPHLDKIQKKALFSQENIYSEKLRPVNSWLLHFHLCMSGKFSPSKQKESRGWLSVLQVPLAGRGKVFRPTTTCTASTRIFFNHECLKVHCASSQPGPADTIHVIGVQKTVNPEFRGTPNCLSLALVKSLSVNERVTDITTIGLVLVWCPVLPGVHHFGFYKLIMLLLLLLVQNMAFVSDCNMVRCNWWTVLLTVSRGIGHCNMGKTKHFL